MRSGLAAIILVVLATAPAGAQGRGGNQPPPVQGPWTDKSLSSDRRAELLLAQMTTDEKITLVHGNGMGFGAAATPSMSNGGAGYVLGIPRLGIPAIQMADAAAGVTRGAWQLVPGDYKVWLGASSRNLPLSAAMRIGD